MDSIIRLEPEKGFVETPHVKNIITKAKSYLDAGYPVHFSGPAGTGKTTLAMHLAYKRGQPVVLIYGDDEYGSKDLVGGEYGYRHKKVVDRFVSRVLKTEEEGKTLWVDNRLTQACRDGHTLIYDEFNRSRPEANNALLSVLEEGILTFPGNSYEDNYLKVHPDFKAIFTSNPREYAGVHKTQDALRDRMLTIDLDFYDEETEILITKSKAGVKEKEAERIVKVVRGLRRVDRGNFTPTVRACIALGRIVKLRKARVSYRDKIFKDTCIDVLTSGINGCVSHKVMRKKAITSIKELMRRYC